MVICLRPLGRQPLGISTDALTLPHFFTVEKSLRRDGATNQRGEGPRHSNCKTLSIKHGNSRYQGSESRRIDFIHHVVAVTTGKGQRSAVTERDARRVGEKGSHAGTVAGSSD